MIYTTQEGQSFDPEILRQELVAAIGADGWYLNSAGNTVEVVVDYAKFEGLILSPPIPNRIADVVETHFANGATRDHNKAILKQIAELEATQTPRRIREGGQWMIDLEVKIAALRRMLK